MKCNRDQAIEAVGIKAVEKVESINCELTGRLIYPAFEPEHEGMQEFRADLELDDGRLLSAYYYQTDKDLEEYSEDWSMLDWAVEHFEIN